MDYEFPLLFVKLQRSVVLLRKIPSEEVKVTQLRDRGSCLQVFYLSLTFQNINAFQWVERILQQGLQWSDSLKLTHKEIFS